MQKLQFKQPKQVTTASSFVTYAATKNSRFSSTSKQLTAEQRWKDTYNSLPAQQQAAVDIALQSAIQEFRRRHPAITSTKELRRKLARACSAALSSVCIDDTMQRQLNIEWVLSLLTVFVTTKVIPIHVYQPNPKVDQYLAWDGQHTLVLLWIICTQIFGENPDNFEIPVNIYDSNDKSEMRTCLIELNSSEGKKGFDLFDRFEQMVYGVRVDGSTNAQWLQAEKKQQIIETHGMFLTSKKFGDHNQPGAISRMQEIHKMETETLEWLCTYLVAAGAQKRPVEEKEMVLMSYFFIKCHKAKLRLTKKQVFDIANLTLTHWSADFSPFSTFWTKVSNAYYNWHSKHIVYGTPRCNKEPTHGYPFLVAQVKKDLKGFSSLQDCSSSEFIPSPADLY